MQAPRIRPRRTVLSAGVLLAVVAAAGLSPGAAGASAPPSSADAVPDAGAGLRRFFTDLGEVVYEGEDVKVGDCPLASAEDVTAAVAGTDPAVAYTADEEAEVGWLGPDPAEGDVIEPVLLICEFEVPGDDVWPDIGIAALDRTHPSTSEWQAQFATLPVTSEQLDVGGTLRAACEDDDCAVVWTGAEVGLLVLADHDDGATDHLDAVLAAAEPLILGALERLEALAPT